MLRFKDKHGKEKFRLRDEDTEPLSIDELIIKERSQEEDDEVGRSTESGN